MSGRHHRAGRDLMEVNGTSGHLEEIYPLQGETIPPVQMRVNEWDEDEAVFLEDQEEIGIRRTVHAVRGNIAPIVQEQEQLRQEMQDLARDAANVLYATTVRSE